MPTDIGEYLVGAYLRLVEKCDFVDYNVRTPNGGRDGLNEIDVLGISLQTRSAHLCEVTTHICGLQYGRNYGETVQRIRAKHTWQQAFARQYLPELNTEFQFWSPVVFRGLMARLRQISGLRIIANGEYRQCVAKLQELAKREARTTQNPVFRVLQILGHLRDG